MTDQAAGGVGRTWHVADAFLDERDSQDVIDCASNGDVILLSAPRTVRLRKRLEVAERRTTHDQTGSVRRDRDKEDSG